jgi:hypothetical protein
MLLALRDESMLVVSGSGMRVSRVFDVFAVAVFGVRRLVGMGCILAGTFLVGVSVMRVGVLGFCVSGRCGLGFLSRGRDREIGEGRRLPGMNMLMLMLVRMFMIVMMVVRGILGMPCVTMMFCIIVVMPGVMRVAMVGVFGALVGGATEESASALSTTSLWIRSPLPRRRALRWRGRRRFERFSVSSSASRWARSSASISACRSATGI